MGLSMAASRVAAPLPKNSMNSTNINSTAPKPSRAHRFGTSVNSMKRSPPPAITYSSSNTVAIPAISLKLLGSTPGNGKTPLDHLLANPIRFVKASLMSPVYKVAPKEVFGVSNRGSARKLRRVKNLPTTKASSSPRKENKRPSGIKEGVEAKTNGTPHKVPSPAPKKDTHKPTSFSVVVNRKDMAKVTYKSKTASHKPVPVVAMPTRAVSPPLTPKLTNGDVEMPDVSSSALGSTDIDMPDASPPAPAPAPTSHCENKSMETSPAAVTPLSNGGSSMDSYIQAIRNDIMRGLINGDITVVKESEEVLTNGTAVVIGKEIAKEVSKKRKVEDPEPSPAAQKPRKDVNGDVNGGSKNAEPLKLNGANGESSKAAAKKPEPLALQPGIRTKGFSNRLNDCYRNSVLQLICSSSVFKGEIVKHDFSKCKIGYCVCCALGSLIMNHHFKSTSNNRNKTNDAIKDVMRLTKVLPRQFRGIRQEDAAEYLHAILHSCKDQLTKSLKGDAAKNNPIDKTFDGSFPSVLTCPKCNHRSFNKTDLPSLMLLPSIKPSQNKVQNAIHLNEVLEDHFKPEKVDATCEKCKFAKRKFTKQVEVEKLPRFLVLNVVRWTQACLRGGVVRADKIMNRLKYEEKMTMMEDGKRVEYLLNAVVAHGGRSLSGGHYISFVRQPDGTWALCNDQYVEQTTWTTVAKADGMQASILGYQRVD